MNLTGVGNGNLVNNWMALVNSTYEYKDSFKIFVEVKRPHDNDDEGHGSDMSTPSREYEDVDCPFKDEDIPQIKHIGDTNYWLVSVGAIQHVIRMEKIREQFDLIDPKYFNTIGKLRLADMENALYICVEYTELESKKD